MRLDNYAVTGSFVWQGQTDDEFRLCVQNLDDMVSYLGHLKNSECIYYSDAVYDQEVLQGTTVTDCYCLSEDDPLHDEKDLLMRTIGTMALQEDEECGQPEHRIDIWFYPIQCQEQKTACVSNLEEYLAARRSILAKLKSPHDFCAFMETCFSDIVFADNIESGLHSIPDFSEPNVRTAIVHDLGVLNDEALDLYREYYPDAAKMCQALGTKVLACSLDSPKHNKHLCFSFSYMDSAENTQIKSICCSPHTKLIRKDSNLRIYFEWQDVDVGAGEKVLVGHIGGHPYPRKR